MLNLDCSVLGGELGLNRVLNKVYTGMVDKKMETNIQFLGARDISPIMEDHMAKGMEIQRNRIGV